MRIAWRGMVVGFSTGVVAVALASCAPGVASRSEPPIGDIPVVRDAGELTLPLDAYDYTNDGYRAFVEAEAMLTQACLRRFGVNVSMSELSADDLPKFDRQNERRYGLLDRTAAASRGYRPPPEPGAQRFSSPAEVEEYRRRQGAWIPSEAEQLLLEGRAGAGSAGESPPLDAKGAPLPENGCRGEAYRILSDGRPDALWPNDAAVESFHRAEQDSRVRAALAAWSECMSRRGYPYSSIWDPNNRDWPDPVTGEEIATAVADVECKLETNIVGVWYAVDAAYQREFIEDNAERLAELRAWLDTVQRNAIRVLEEVR